MRCEDRGEDLVARALGQVGPDMVREIDAHLSTCAVCRDEAARIEADLRRAKNADGLAPPADGLARLLAAVGDEAADRRAAAAVSTSRACEAVREDAVALAVGALPDASHAAVEAHLAACAPCAAEREVAARLLAAQRSAPSVAIPAGGLARLVASLRTEIPGGGAAAPVISLPARRKSAARRLALLAPLAAAAVVVAAILASADGRIAARIDAGGHVILRDTSATPMVPPAVVDAATARELGADWDLSSGSEPVELSLGLGRDPSQAAAPGADEVRITLLPGTRLATVDRRALELREGRLRVRAGTLRRPLEIRAGDVWARVVGTRFEVARAEDRLVVQVEEGVVELGRDGGTPLRLAAGRRGLAGPGRLFDAATDARDAVEALLAPVAHLTGPVGPLAPGTPVEFDAEIACGPGGPVTIAPFDASEPRFLVRLKGPDGREREVKVLPSMLRDAEPAPLAARIDEASPYRLRLRIPLEGGASGPWEARLRYHSYRPRESQAEWLGTVESAEARFEVRRE